VTPLSQREREQVLAAVAAHGSQPGPVLEVLHAVQDALGFVPAGAVPLIAVGLNLSRAEVHGVLSFYHHFRTAPPGRHVLRVCRAEACQSMGGRALEAQVQRSLGVGYHATTADGAVTLEPVYCLGNCACAPAVMLDGELHGRVDGGRLDELLACCRRDGEPR
jgi:formate dehydrogenase subunit gamma